MRRARPRWRGERPNRARPTQFASFRCARGAYPRRPRFDRGRRRRAPGYRGRPALCTQLLGLAHDRGFKAIVATRGAAGLSLARQFRPDAISLDIYLPDMLGWTVLNNLKSDPAMRHIPVLIFTVDEERQSALAHGAFSYLVKSPTTEGIEAALERLRNFTAPRTKRLLVVEDNDIERQSIVELLNDEDIELLAVATGGEAIEALTATDIRLRGARFAFAGYQRLRASGAVPLRAGLARYSGRHLHRQRAFRRRRSAA